MFDLMNRQVLQFCSGIRFDRRNAIEFATSECRRLMDRLRTLRIQPGEEELWPPVFMEEAKEL